MWLITATPALSQIVPTEFNNYDLRGMIQGRFISSMKPEFETLHLQRAVFRAKALELLFFELALHVGAKTPDKTLELLTDHLTVLAMVDQNPEMAGAWEETISKRPSLFDPDEVRG